MSKAQIFDVYVGERIDACKKSVAINLTFQDPTKTLDEATINDAMENILEEMKKQYHAELRA